MYWSKPDQTGDIIGPHRSHSATAVEDRIFVFGGGEGQNFTNELFVLDTSNCFKFKSIVIMEKSLHKKK